MNYQKIYNDTVWDCIQLLSSYKEVIERNDLMGMEQSKAKLVALKGILNQIYCDSCGFFTDEKRKVNNAKDKLYLMYRDQGLSQGDAEKKSRLDTDYKDEEGKNLLDKYKLQRNKTGKMIEDTKEAIIELAILIKSKKSQIKYD